MKKIYALIFISLFQVIATAQQDAQYNLYQFNQLIINPAYAGARNGLSAIGSVRQQWAGIDGAPRTICFSAHKPIVDKNLGVGATIVSDKLGPTNMIGIYGYGAYILTLTREWKLSFGLNAGYNRYQFYADEVNMQVVESLTPYQTQTSSALDLNGGTYLKSNDFFFGVSLTHLNTPNVYSYEAVQGTFNYKLRTQLFVSGGKSMKLADNLIFAPTFLFKMVNGQTGTDINLNFLLNKKLWLGAFYRYGYGPGALFQYHVTNTIRVAYSYDTGLQDARRLGGSNEVMVGIDLGGKKAKIINPRFL